jgi:hypothetical protein
MSIAICCPEWSDIKYTWISPPSNKSLVNLILCPPIRRYWTKFMNAVMWKHWNVRLLDQATFITATQLPFKISCNLIPTCSFENVFFTYFVNEISEQNFHAIFREFIYVTIPRRSCLSHHQIYPLDKDITSATSQHYVHPVTKKHTVA